MANPHSTILIKKQYTQKQLLAWDEHPGKSRGTTAGSWISDLVAAKKVVTLCPLCTHKFNPGRLGYRKEKEFPYVQAKCDGCQVFDIRCTAYFNEETYSQVRSTAEDRRAERRKSQLSLKREGHL